MTQATTRIGAKDNTNRGKRQHGMGSSTTRSVIKRQHKLRASALYIVSLDVVTTCPGLKMQFNAPDTLCLNASLKLLSIFLLRCQIKRQLIQGVYTQITTQLGLIYKRQRVQVSDNMHRVIFSCYDFI